MRRRGVKPSADGGHPGAPGALGAAAFGALVAALYGRHLGVGYLADDFLFLEWAAQGPAELLRRVTGGGEPGFIRPLPAFLWYLGPSAAGAAAHHAVSLAAHLLCGVLVARIAAHRCHAREPGLVAGALFLAFPLFTEPVIWLSAGPDLWACCFALAALDVGLRGGDQTAASAGASALFAAALLSKESVLMLPLLVPLFAPWRESRRLCLAFGLVAAAYLGIRLALLGGPGGYTDAAGRSLAWRFDPIFFLRNLCLQLPYRVLVPLKRAGELVLPLAALSAVLELAFAATTGIWRRPHALAAALAAFGVALLPTAPLFSIDVDHESSRLLYFPLAVLALAAAPCLPRTTRGSRLATLLLLIYWGTVTIANGRAWTEAGREVERTLTLMRRIEERYEPRTTVLIAGREVWKGAYVWRNGLAFASRLDGLRRDLHWVLGTAAILPDAGRLGVDAFAIGFDAEGHAADWTACERALRASGVPVLAGFDWPVSNAGKAGPPRRRFSPTLPLTPGTRAPAVRLRFAGCPRGGADGGRPRDVGRLYWRQSDRRRFTVTDARRFLLPAASPGDVVVRLPPATSAIKALELRVETAPAGWLGCLRRAEILGGPPACAGQTPAQSIAAPSPVK